MFETYCRNWKLTVNLSITKIIVFGNIRGRVPEFKISGHTLEVNILVSTYPSLCHSSQLNVIFQNKQIKPSTLSLKSKTLGVPSDLQLDLFDKTVNPILLYGADMRCDSLENLICLSGFN